MNNTNKRLTWILALSGFIFFIFFGPIAMCGYKVYTEERAKFAKASETAMAAMLLEMQVEMQTAEDHQKELREKYVSRLITDITAHTFLDDAMQLLGQMAALYCPLSELQELIG